MSIPATAPVHVTSEAAAHIGDLDMQAEFERMIGQLMQIIPDLKRIEVILAEPYDTGDECSVGIDAVMEPADSAACHRVSDEYRRWVIDTFGPDVLRHFSVGIWEDDQHGG